MSSVRPPTLHRASRVRRILLGLLIANVAIVAIKLAIGLAAHSLAILGGALDSVVDALNNGLAMVLVRVAAKEPDEEHPYGHGKFETLGMLAIVVFLFVSCFELLRGAVNHLTSDHHPVLATDLQLAILLVTLAGGALVAWYEH